MHKQFINGDVSILESFIAPVSFTVGTTKVRKGTWLMALRVTSDKIWKQIKGGELTGFSIGGSAVRAPA
jgi:DNA adenine methylase